MIEKLNTAYIQVESDSNAKLELANKINELVYAVNAIQKGHEAERFEIQEWIGILEAVRKSVNIHEKQIDELQMKLEPHKCEPAENGKISKIEQDHRPNMVMDDPFGPHPNIYEQSMRMDKEFAEDECARLQDELDRTHKALDVARHTIGWINQMIDERIDKQAIKIKCEYALEQITALEQKE